MNLIAQLGYWNWFIIGFILLILESVLPGVFLMWFGFAALLVGLITVFFTTIGLALQILLFAVFSIILCYLWVGYQRKEKTCSKKNNNNTLNQRDQYMIGKIGVICEIFNNHQARAKFDDSTWKVEGNNLKLGQNIKVYGVTGIVLKVKVIDEN